MSGINSNLFIISVGKIVRFIEERIYFPQNTRKYLAS